jgi:hypothetical protein
VNYNSVRCFCSTDAQSSFTVEVQPADWQACKTLPSNAIARSIQVPRTVNTLVGKKIHKSARLRKFNIRAAQAIGLTLPPSLLLEDEVIE